MKKLFLFSLVLLGFTAGAFAQVGPTVTSTATASAVIVTPLTISAATANLNFGNIVPGTGGTVTIDPAGAATYTGGTTGSTFPTASATTTAASFDITGTGGALFAITLPVSVTLNGPLSATMTANNFKSDPDGTGTLAADGTAKLNVGATLTVASGQAAGTYTSAPFNVSVNYN